MGHYERYPRDTSISSITVKRYNDLCRTFERYRRTNNILDLGCGDGHFLAVAKDNGWNVFGTEYTDKALEICTQKGIHMKRGPLKVSDFESSFFDVITSFEVIEHINNPREEALSISKILRSGGLLYVTTPNFNSISRFLLGPRWNIIEYPEHLSYYTKATLVRLFRNLGFEVQSVKSTGISFDRIRKRSSAANWMILRGTDEDLRQKTEKNVLFRMAKTLVNFALNLMEKGDSLKISFVKK